jgi:predicted AAA+ superfamily ATPase
MREEDFRWVLADWKTRKLPSVVEREIKLPLDPTYIVTVTGPRQAGKTYRLFQLVGELMALGVPRSNILYVNFEHERLRRLDANDLEDMVKVYYEMFEPDVSRPIYLLLDEVQLVNDWDKWVRRVHDSEKYRIYITGSTSKLTSKEIADALRGRSVDYTVFPFSFREFTKAKRAEIRDPETLSYLEERGIVLRLLREYLVYGGFPRVVLAETPEEKRALLKSHYNAIFYRDLVERCRLDPGILDLILSSLVTGATGLFSVSKLYNFAKSLGYRTSKAKLIEYVECARQAYLVLLSEIYSPTIRNRKQYPKKAYIIDNGIITTLSTESTENLGKLMENIVAVELARNGYTLNYWREYGKREGPEVDFVITEGQRPRQLIQVTYASSKTEIKPREKAALIKASQELQTTRALVITWDLKAQEQQGDLKITYIPLWQWLLQPQKYLQPV